MELPPWLKIQNLIGKLNISGWFRRENKTKIIINKTNNINIQVLPIRADEEPQKLEPGEIPEQKIETEKKKEFEFDDNEKNIIDKINQIHKLNNSKYNFEESYRLSLQHIKNKETSDWYNIAASHMANAIQSGDTELGIEHFFDSFESEMDPQKNNSFIGLKNKIKYCYEKLQNLRHIDKSGEFKKSMISEYDQKIHEQYEISEQSYQKIFSDFQEFLLELFANYKLKIKL